MTSLSRILQKFLGTGVRRGDPRSLPIELSIEGFDTVYAIGDVHGCLETLQGLEQKIETTEQSGKGSKAAILYLGDLIDRGPKSAHVLDYVTGQRDGLPRLALRGNHEELFLRFLGEPQDHLDWLDFGGLETLNSYGIYKPRRYFKSARQSELRALLDASIPAVHKNFLSGLPHFAQSDNFLFCHAGVNPTRQINEQTAEDFMWARERFISHIGGFEVRIVHGHTPQDKATETDGRIGLDTGAYYSGILSCARVDLSQQDVSFFSFNSSDKLVGDI